MKLGAQVYSVRNYIQTPDAYGETMKKLKAAGYDTIQHAGPDISDPYLLRDLTQEAGLTQICPNFNANAVLETPEKVIECVQVLGCDSIMLPYVGNGPMNTLEGFLKGWNPLMPSLRKLQEAGIRLCYHNHDFDIAPISNWDGSFLDYLMLYQPDWEFILDVAWSQYANVDTLDYLEKLGKRLNCVHFKDYTPSINSKHQPVFCACGSGLVELDIYAQKVKELGIADVIVEQDNAQDYPDPFGQMSDSAACLQQLF